MLSFSELHQFLRMPVLIQHFMEHRQKDRSISLLAFLKEHYINQYIRDADYQRDQQLPFRHTDCCVASINANISCECPVNNLVEVPVHTTITSNRFIVHDEDSHSLLSVADIFQPPRHA
jgi:hypothetical protein